MMPKEPARFIFAGLLLPLVAMLSFGANAQEKWYQVEVIVFERLDEEGLQAESWRPDPGQPPVDQSIRLTRPGETPLEGSGPHAFRLLDSSEFQLLSSWKHLSNAQTFRPVLHNAWRQPGLPRESSRWTHVFVPSQGLLEAVSTFSFLPPPPALLDGTLRVYLARYLHVEVDLLYHRSGVETPIRLRTSRRMRSGELHYLDHPLLGVLVLVTPVELETTG